LADFMQTQKHCMMMIVQRVLLSNPLSVLRESTHSVHVNAYIPLDGAVKIPVLVL
jgi:hypothetical protein